MKRTEGKGVAWPVRYYKTAKPPKVFVQKICSITHIRLDNLVDLLGAENAFKLIKYYAGATFHIPKISLLKTDIRNMLMREDAQDMKKKGVKQADIIIALKTKYDLGKHSIERIIYGYNFFKPDRKRLVKNTFKLHKQRTPHMLDIIYKYSNELRDLGLLFLLLHIL